MKPLNAILVQIVWYSIVPVLMTGGIVSLVALGPSGWQDHGNKVGIFLSLAVAYFLWCRGERTDVVRSSRMAISCGTSVATALCAVALVYFVCASCPARPWVTTAFTMFAAVLFVWRARAWILSTALTMQRR